VSLIKWIDFKVLGDERGSLVALEIGNDKELPFTVRRVYYIYHTAEGVSRGYHAHRDLKQVAICVAGSCRMVLDNGSVREEVVMNCPTKGLLIESMDCVLLVLASNHYDEADYIRDYSNFLRIL
jgi:hypothetical protein